METAHNGDRTYNIWPESHAGYQLDYGDERAAHT